MREYFSKIYQEGQDAFAKVLEGRLKNDEKTFVVTANPETLMIGNDNPEFDQVLKSDKTIIVPDGIGVVKAAQFLKYPVDGRVTGVEIVQKLLELANKEHKKLFLFGSKQEVMDQFVKKIEREYPNIQVVGHQNGYVSDRDAVFDEIVQTEPDIVLVALGIPSQELLIFKNYDRFSKGIFVGVGGSFDVLSGMKKRAPKIFIKLNLEWLYRITSEPARFKRFYKSNVKFISKIIKMR